MNELYPTLFPGFAQPKSLNLVKTTEDNLSAKFVCEKYINIWKLNSIPTVPTYGFICLKIKVNMFGKFVICNFE